MAVFSFRLEKVLRYRAHMEKKVRLQFSETATKVKDLETAITQLGNHRAKAAKAWAEERSKGIDVSQDRLHGFFLLELEERAAVTFDELKKTKEKLEVLRKLVTIAAAKRKSLDTLKDIHFERYKEESGKREQKFLDELVVTTKRGRER